MRYESLMEDEKVKQYVNKVLYDNYWYIILPIKTSGFLVYSYYYTKKGYKFSEIYDQLKKNKVDFNIPLVSTKEAHYIEKVKKEVLEKNDCFYPTNIDDAIKLLKMFNLIHIRGDRFVFNNLGKDIFYFIKYIPDELINEIEEFNKFKKIKGLIENILTNINDFGELSLNLKDFLDDRKANYKLVSDTINFLNTYLMHPISTENLNSEKIELKFDICSNKFKDLKLAVDFMKGGNTYTNKG